MSAYVCVENRTYSAIIELAMKQETITNPDLLAQRLYLLNVESVNQRYNLKDSKDERNRQEYKQYFDLLPEIRFEPQPDLCDAQRIKAAHCWMYQSCEGNCMEDPLYKAVQKISEKAEIECAKAIVKENGGSRFDLEKERMRIIYDWLDARPELKEMWE